MKKIVSIITVLLAVLFVQAQTITQNGVSYRYNGKNPRTPIGGVYIKPVTADNGVVSNASNGSFSVVLKNLKMGSRIGNVKVTKQGMMVFNQQAVDEWNVRKDPLCLILCDANEFQKQKKNLIAIGERQAKKKYDKKLAELKKKNEAQQLQIDDYYNKLDSLEKEYQNALKHMDEYADVFARIDESEIDTLAQRAIELFNKGEIDESIRLFEQGNYMKKLDDALHTKAQAQNLRNVADSAEALADKDIEEYVKSIKAQVSAYQVKNDYEKVGELLKGMADRLQTLDAIWDYLDFCNMQHKFKEEELYSQKYLNILEKSQIEDKEVYQASLYNSLGNLYSDTQRFYESEVMYKTSLDIYKRLSKGHEIEYTPDLAMSYNNLAILYQETKRLDESETMYKASLNMREELAKSNPIKYGIDLANSYNNFAGLYLETQRFKESEETYLAALKINALLTEQKVKKSRSHLAMNYNNLGILYEKMQRFGECEKMYQASLEIRKELVKENPYAYEASLANIYNNIANLYGETQRSNESAAMYKASLEIFERLAKVNPKVYEPNLAMLYYNLGSYYKEEQRFEESETMYKACLNIFERLAKDNPQIYESDLAILYQNLGSNYQEEQRFEESEAMYLSCIKIYFQLYKKNPSSYRKTLGDCYYWLGKTMIENNKSHDAIDVFEKSLRLTKEMISDEEDSLSYAINLMQLTDLYGAEKKYETAYNYNTELLVLLKNYYFAEHVNYKNDYSHTLINHSFYANLLGKFKEGEEYSLEALQVDSTKHIAYTNLAAALLFQGKIEEAEKIYRQYKSEFKDGFLGDFAEYERLQVIPKEYMADVERIKAMLKE